MSGVLTVKEPVWQFTNLSFWEKLIDLVSPIPKWNVFEGDIENQEHLKAYINIMTNMILGTKNFLHGVAGEFCSLVWSQPEIIEALKNTDAKEICFICGPKFDINNINFMKLLVKDKRIKLLRVQERMEQHFRVTDNSLIIEGYHKNFASKRKAVFCNSNSIKIQEYDNKFRYLLDKLRKQDNLEKVDAQNILKKFEIEIYDVTMKGDKHYRKPKENEIDSAFQALYGRYPTKYEIEDIQRVQNEIIKSS